MRGSKALSLASLIWSVLGRPYSYAFVPEVYRATAFIDNPNPAIKGTIRFTQMNDDDIVAVHGNLTGLTPGKHGLHIHQYGDIGNECSNAGPHYNPHNKTHSAPKDSDRHVGDLGNIVSDSAGNVVFVLHDSLIRLHGGNSIVGRSIVIHEKEDNLGHGEAPGSKETGDAGKRIACGIIGYSK
ncbi:copper/zinc binding superoxide dismutase [Basidiobolus meristosporus CBS 931.73]|uniref:Superoxide dismutase [Cu-Zn] n=1 Tax=Basidiobolus meristosporus CBS 931.73 TaxID=1314790 RepID=A0A1Y1XER8_9FUNG|nr:copper/zinc binding superoxide dismutase [Basidiobolus meristosporus CBS 931.73]|eukprot:ORX83864.1 copper/zinc binding superoxide dismutase [Basidiobolus meristosporus CBS 931.73]